MPKTETYREVKLKLELTITVRAKYDADEIAEMLQRGVRCAFPNNAKEVVFAEFKDSQDSSSGSEWRSLY